MWICPKCGREFKRNQQDHYCGTPPETIEEYILRQPENIQPYLWELHETISQALPKAAERISWSMPTYGKPTIVQFAAFQNHVSLYVGEQAIQKFAEELSGITCKKSAIYHGYGQPLPRKLITDMLHWCEDPGV